MDIALKERKWKIDLPSVNGKYFINVAAIGNLIDLSQKTPPHLKQRFGMLAYYMQGLKELKNIKSSRVTIERYLVKACFTKNYKIIYKNHTVDTLMRSASVSVGRPSMK